MSKPNTPLFLTLLGLTILAGILINLPYHNFQNFLAQGDHGRDLYAAEAVLRGELPYKNFWWVYGPLMPYYYGAFFKFFGVAITSILLGKIILNILAGVFFFLGLCFVVPQWSAFLGALWLLVFHQDFFFTYNHAGGIALILFCVWMNLGYLKTSQIRYAFISLLGVFILGLIKINFAITALGMSLLTVAVKDFIETRPLDSTKKLWVSLGVIGLPLAWLGIYAYFLNGLSVHEIRQCLPYLGGDEPYNNLGPLETIPVLLKTIWTSITASGIDIALCILVLACSARTAILIWKKKLLTEETTMLWLLLGYGILFYVVNLHEFIKSGVFYRAFWSQPFSIFLCVILINTGLSLVPKFIKTILALCLVGVALLATYSSWQRVNDFKNPQHFFGGARGGVYITNDRSWIQTVVLTTKQLNTHFNKDELFLALPYDCLYYYLTGKRSPTRQLIFFDHIHIAPEQEQKIIAELEAVPIHGILVSSRQSSHEQGLGTLGVNYCPLMTQYIMTNFSPVAKIGDWEHEPGWAWNHGTLIYKRKQ